MNKAISFFRLGLMMLMLLCCFSIKADDVIVMRNGDVVNAKVTEITQDEIKYKKASRPDGPLYTVNKSDVLAINYEDGEKETFEDYAPAANEEPSGVTYLKPENLSPEIAQLNAQAIQKINREVPTKCEDKEIGKKSKDIIYRFLVDENSILLNEDLAITLTPGKRVRWGKKDIGEFKECHTALSPALLVTISNKSNSTIYLDLGNTFFIRQGKPICYYVPSVTTSASSSTTGGSVNLGSVAGAMGIGGGAKALASGVNVGGGNTSTTGTTIFSQRIIAIPANTSYELGAEYILMDEVSNGQYPLCKGLYYKVDAMWVAQYNGFALFNFLEGSESEPITFDESFRYTSQESPLKVSYSLTYSKTEDLKLSNTFEFSLYLGELVGGYYDGENLQDLLFYGGKAHTKKNEPVFPRPN